MLNHSSGRRRKSRPLFTLSVVAAGVVTLGACGSTAAGPSSGSPHNGPWNIAYLAQGTTNAFAAQLDAIVKKTAKDSGKVKNLTYFDGTGDGDKQLGQMETALTQKPDAIILTPLGKAALTALVDRAYKSGIPVILCDSTINSKNYTSLVGPSSYEAALPLAKWLVNDQLKGTGNIAVVDGIAGNDTSEQFGKAIRDAAKGAPGIKLVQQGYGSFSVSKSKQLAQTFLSSGLKIDGWWGSGGESVAGIMGALIDANTSPMPPVAGAAATNGTLRLASQYKIPVGMLQFPATSGKNCVDTALGALEGKSVPKFVNLSALPGNGDFYTADVPKYYNPKYTDDYQTGTDAVLNQDELRALNLLK